jgi:hypothetical protein
VSDGRSVSVADALTLNKILGWGAPLVIGEGLQHVVVMSLAGDSCNGPHHFFYCFCGPSLLLMRLVQERAGPPVQDKTLARLGFLRVRGLAESVGSH